MWVEWGRWDVWRCQREIIFWAGISRILLVSAWYWNLLVAPLVLHAMEGVARGYWLARMLRRIWWGSRGDQWRWTRNPRKICWQARNQWRQTRQGIDLRSEAWDHGQLDRARQTRWIWQTGTCRWAWDAWWRGLGCRVCSSTRLVGSGRARQTRWAECRTRLAELCVWCVGEGIFIENNMAEDNNTARCEVIAAVAFVFQWVYPRKIHRVDRGESLWSVVA